MHPLFATACTLPWQQASITARISFRWQVNKRDGGQIDAERYMTTTCHCVLLFAVTATACTHTCISLAPCWHHAPICVLMLSMSKQMESNPRRLRGVLHKSQSIRERTGGHVARHMSTTSQPTTNVGSCTVYQTSRASFKRSVAAQIACLRSDTRYWNITKWCYCCSSLTNACNCRYTDPRAWSNPSKNFASMVGEQMWMNVIEGGFSRRCLATTCHYM